MIHSKAWMLGLLLILSVVCSASLAYVNFKTEPVIRRNAEQKRMMTVLNVFGVAYDPTNASSVRDTYDSRITEGTDRGFTVFHEKETGQTAIELSGSGFQSTIAVVVALKDDTISGFRVVKQSETPGLGSRITEESFQKQFIGKKVSGGIRYTKSGNAGDSEFDAVTGATESSKALARILDNGFRAYFDAAK